MRNNVFKSMYAIHCTQVVCKAIRDAHGGDSPEAQREGAPCAERVGEARDGQHGAVRGVSAKLTTAAAGRTIVGHKSYVIARNPYPT